MIPALVTRLRFTLLSFAAAMLALYLAMCIDLQQPYWAMMTVYIVSSPLTAAVRSKAMYRLLGSLLGASVALVLVPLLDNTPVLLCLAVALWVAGCLTVSLLDRSPRSYVMLLAGYTAAIIGFSSVDRPEAIFDIALARGEEILLGTLCATLLHSLWFPQAVADPLRARIRACLGHAGRWADDLLAGGDAATFERDRQQLAAAANDIHQLATHLPYDTSHLRETRAEVQAVHDRILLLIPVLASLSDRLAALRADGNMDAAGLADATTRVAAWLTAPAPASAADTLALLAELDARIAAAPHADWAELARLGALVRLQDLVRLLSEAQELLA
ncbi:MAG: FUSC family protein, partial [Pseudomonadota bacterium]|nr:FUSC family protein [Pseudomonadota bacterium]